MFQFINIGSPVARRLSGLVGSDISRRIPSARAADIGGTRSIRAHRKDRMRRYHRFGVHLLLAAMLASLSGVAAARDRNAPTYRLDLSSTEQLFASETFNGDLARFTKLQPRQPGAMQVKMRLADGVIGSMNFWSSQAFHGRYFQPISANIEYCLSGGAVFGETIDDGGYRAYFFEDNGPIVNRGGREVEVLRFGDFEFVNSDRDGDNIDFYVIAGGLEGSRCVTVELTIRFTNTFFTYNVHSIEEGDEIIFNIPSIKNAQVLGTPGNSISVRVRMLGYSTVGFHEGWSQQKSGQYFYEDYDFGHHYRPIARSARALQLHLQGRGSFTVRDYDPRSFDHPGIGAGFISKIAPIAAVSLRERGGTQYTSNGTRDFRLRDPHSNRHRLRVTATGPFTSGDRVFMDLDGDRQISGGEEFRFNDDRTAATGAFNIQNPIENRQVYFVASRDHDINPGNYSVNATYDFDFRSYKDVASNRVTTRINGHPSRLPLHQTASATVYAIEVFGEGSEETLLNARGMSTTLTAEEGTGGGRSRLRFELEEPAVFGVDIRASHLTAPNSDVSVVSGTGTAGSRSVEFNVNTGSGGIREGESFTFNIPSIRNGGALGEVGGTIGVTASIASRNDEFSSDSIYVDNTTIAESAYGFVYNLHRGEMAAIDSDNSAMLTGDPNVDMDGDGTNDTRALMLGTFFLDRSEGVQHDHDGGDMPIRTVDEVILTVPDLFLNEGDQVFIDLDGDMHIGQGEAFAAVDEDADDHPAVTLTLAGPDATTDRDGAHVYYVPAGTESLAPTTYTLVADYEFGRADGEAENYRPLVLTAESSTISAVDDLTRSLVADGRADTIPGSGEDGSNVVIHIRNRNDSPVTVYVRGRLDDGSDIGPVAMFEVDANDTAMLTPGGFEELFCGTANSACWSGYAHFRFFRSADDDIIVSLHVLEVPDEGSDDTDN